MLGPLLELSCWKKVHAFVARSISKANGAKHLSVGALLEAEMSKKCTPLWLGSASPSQNVKSTACSDHFWTFSCRFAGARDGAPCPKWAKREGIVAVSKHFAWIGVAFWSMRSSGLPRWFRVTGAALRMTWPPFRSSRSAWDRWSGKIARRNGARPSALHSTFHFWRKSRRIASFLMLSTLKIEEVSHTCLVFDVVKFKNWGSLAE